jgi:hypothetical protein
MANGLVQFGALVGVTYILKYRFKDKRERERGPFGNPLHLDRRGSGSMLSSYVYGH